MRTGRIFDFPWHRHQIEGTNGFYCLIRKTLARGVNGIVKVPKRKVFTEVGLEPSNVRSPVDARRYEIVHSVAKLYLSGLNVVDVFDTSCQCNSRAERAKAIYQPPHCLFKLYTSQNCSVEFGYLDNLRNGGVVLDYTLLTLRHEHDAFRTNQEKPHLFFCTAYCRRAQVACDSLTLQ